MLLFLPQESLILTVPSSYLEVKFSGKKRGNPQEIMSASETLFSECFFSMKETVQIVLNINNYNNCIIVPNPLESKTSSTGCGRTVRSALAFLKPLACLLSTVFRYLSCNEVSLTSTAGA